MLLFKIHTERILCKFCHVDNFRTFVDGLYSVRMYEEQIQQVKYLKKMFMEIP